MNHSKKKLSQIKLEKRGYLRPAHQKPPRQTPTQSPETGATSSTPVLSSKEN